MLGSSGSDVCFTHLVLVDFCNKLNSVFVALNVLDFLTSASLLPL